MATREEMEALQRALQWADNKPRNTKKSTADAYARQGKKDYDKSQKKGKK